VVVAEDRGREPGGGSEIAAVCAQVVPSSQRRIEHIVRVGPAVTVPVDRPPPPGARNELHRPYGAVKDRVAVVHTVIGVADDRVARNAPVEPRAENAASRGPIGIKPP
jgi:hypothetical protein